MREDGGGQEIFQKIGETPGGKDLNDPLSDHSHVSAVHFSEANTYGPKAPFIRHFDFFRFEIPSYSNCRCHFGGPASLELRI